MDPRLVILVLSMLQVLASTKVSAQNDDIRVTWQTWADYTAYKMISNKFELYGDVGARHLFDRDLSWSRFYIRPGIKYQVNSWLSLRAGFGTFFTAHKSLDNQMELRPFQGVAVSWPNLPLFKFANYVRLEQRIIYNLKTGDNNFDLRFRYQFSTSFKPSRVKKVKYFYIPAFFELFVDRITSNEITEEMYPEDVRLGIGAGYIKDKNWSGQFMIIFQRARSDLGNFKTSDLIFRFSIKHKISPKSEMDSVID